MLPGDIVSRRKGLVMHRGIVLGDGQVLHNTPLQGEHVSSISEFSRGRKVTPHALSKQQRDRILRRVDSQDDNSNRRYNLFTHNCEHTVTHASTEKPRSPQLGSWLVGAGVAATVLVLTRHPGWALTGFYTGKTIYKKLARDVSDE